MAAASTIKTELPGSGTAPELVIAEPAPPDCPK
jgi:hypothetical protein